MRKSTLHSALLIFLIHCGLAYQAQSNKTLSLSKNSEFKIVQLTDMHINKKKEDIIKALSVVEEVVTNEKPDLAVFTGDIVTERNPKDAFGKLPPGGRAIVLQEGKRKFDTRIHETGGKIILKSSYPDSFK